MIGAIGKQRTYAIVRRRWPKKSRTATGWLMPLELLVLVPLLVIFGISQPDLYRSAMWKIGFDNGLNSNPNMILYAYANHRPLPTVPLIWSLTLTNFNVACSITSLFFLLVKLIAFIMRAYYPILAIFINFALIALYTVSVYGQIGPDYADARYPAPAAWYFRRGCGPAKAYGKYKACQIAQASLGLTLLMLVIYLVNMGFAIYAMLPIQKNIPTDEEDHASTTSDLKEGTAWEMPSLKGVSEANTVPFTPRTEAFHKLDRKLPLRQYN